MAVYKQKNDKEGLAVGLASRFHMQRHGEADLLVYTYINGLITHLILVSPLDCFTPVRTQAVAWPF